MPSGGNALGYIPSPVDHSQITHTPETAARVKIYTAGYASSYDLRAQGKVTPIENQGNCGDCWAFATFASLESVLLTSATWNFSENNLNNLNGFDYGACKGGNYDMSAAYLARRGGPILASADPNYSYSYYPNCSETDPGACPPSPPNLPAQKYLQEVLFLPQRTSPTDNSTIKWALTTYGAVGTYIYVSETPGSWGFWNNSTDAYFNAATSAYYMPLSSGTNHAVTIVGWDDNYAASNFSSPQPPGNGAFIIKNSWGTGWGAAGYFYMSYYSYNGANGCLTGNTVFDVAQSTAVPPGAYLYSYDPLGQTAADGYGTTTAWLANIFTSSATVETIQAVGFYTTDISAGYTVKVYLKPTAGSPTSGTLADTETGTFTYPGYHTVVLSKPATVLKGQNFSLVVGLTNTSYAYPVAIHEPIPSYSSSAKASAGQSFISYNGSNWQDETARHANTNVCAKAQIIYRNTVAAVVQNIQPATLGSSSLMWSWSPALNATSYHVYYATSPTVIIATVTAVAAPSFTLTGLRANTAYGIVIRAANPIGESDPSAASSATTAASAFANPPVITSALSASGTVGKAFSYSIAASNSPASFNATNLPAGLSVNANNGLIAGTPSAAGTSNVAISAANAYGTGTATLVITTISQTPVITSPLSTSGQVGKAFSYSITASNSPTTFNAVNLPAGLSVNAGNGVISGTPSAAGTSYVTISAANAYGTGTATLILTVTMSAPVINSALSASGQVGKAFSYSISASNSPTSFNAVNLPAGLSVNTSNGVISGTPSATGTSYVTISAVNGAGTGTATLALAVTAAPAPVITSALSASGQVGKAFSYSIAASNSPTSFNAANLPAGLSINTSNGVISGTPAAAGTGYVTISAANAYGTGTATLVLAFTAAPAPVINSALSASGTAGKAFTYYITASNNPTSFNAVNLPAGLSVTSNGVILGTPSATGTSYVTISATNAGGKGTATLVLTINLPSPPVITSALYVSGIAGQPFSYSITASNSPTGFNAVNMLWGIFNLGLPAGLSINTSNGVISGTPSTTGTTNLTISASNSAGTGTATLVLTITAPPAPVITSALSASGQVGKAFSYTIRASNSPTSFNAANMLWGMFNMGLPAGLSVNTSNGVISGTPSAAATTDLTISAANAGGTGTATLVLTITPPAVKTGNLVLAGAVTTLLMNGLPASATSFVLVSTDTLSLAASDSGPAVAQTLYAVDGSSPTVFTSAFSLPVGAHTLAYYSVDQASNVETPKIVSISVRAASALLAPRPANTVACNPLRPACQPMTFQGLPADARLRIYTLAGELVRDLAVEGSGRATWDGTNQNGSPAAGGVYFVFVQGSGTSQTIKIAVQR